MENLKISEKLFEDVIYFVLGSLDDEVKKRRLLDGLYVCPPPSPRCICIMFATCACVCMFECVRAFIHLFWCPCSCTRHGNNADGKIYEIRTSYLQSV